MYINKRRFFKRLKNSEKGSITVFVLSTMIVIVGAVFSMYFSMVNKSNNQEKQLEKIESEYNQSNETMKQIYEDIINN